MPCSYPQSEFMTVFTAACVCCWILDIRHKRCMCLNDKDNADVYKTYNLWYVVHYVKTTNDVIFDCYTTEKVSFYMAKCNP